MMENRIHIFKVTGQVLKEQEGGDTSIEYTLSKEYISIDKAHAIYFSGFDNHFRLIGFLRAVFSPEGRQEVLNTTRHPGDYFLINKGRYAVVWSGLWDMLEREGITAITFQTSIFEGMINEIYKWMKDHDGKLVDRR
ncbi:MAG: hypothetical protein ACTSVR_04860 [Candidatus Thorarchaeota archaeon]